MINFERDKIMFNQDRYSNTIEKVDYIEKVWVTVIISRLWTMRRVPPLTKQAPLPPHDDRGW